jgi:penicillin amidase
LVLKWAATGLAVGVALLLLFLVWSTRRPFPQISGDITISGLDATVDVIRDEYGVPHIYASTVHDLFLAQGFVHAQDRFWQMDTWRHIGSGRLAEMFGEDQVETDAFLRTMGWGDLASAQYASTSDLGRDALTGYVAGVNSYLGQRSPAELGFEYTVMEAVNRNYTPEPWTAIDSILWGKVMAWDLRGNMMEEIARSFLLDDFTPAQVDMFYPPYPDDHPVIVGNSAPRVTGPGLDPLPLEVFQTIGRTAHNAALLDSATGGSGVGIGSNSWVIAPERSTTGAAILANDPHLGIRMPSIWYQVGLHCVPLNAACPFDVAGFSFAGMPGVIIGHNDRVAWGLTNLGPDVVDLYVERINPSNPFQYEVNGEWVDMEVRTETIEVAGGDAATVTIRNTRHGPIISDDYGVLEDFADSAGIPMPDEYAIAMRWTALEENSSLVDAVLQLDLARDFESFRNALRLFDVPSQNMVYADVDGNIGYQAPGLIPIRSNGDGRIPVPGWTNEYEWTGYIPFEELPSVYNPAEGYIVTANNPVIDGSYPYLLTTDWNYGDRAARIVELIEANPAIDLDYMAGMQFDNYNRHADRLLPWILGLDVSGEDGALVRARELLAAWDRLNAVDSSGAAIFEATWRHLLSLTFHDDLVEDSWPTGGTRWSLAVSEMMDLPKWSVWDDSTTSEVEDRDAILDAAFRAGVEELQELLGDKPDEWEWGQIHGAVFRNETLGESGVGLIEGRFNRGPYPAAGGTDIVNAVGYYADEGYEVTWVPSMRMIVDLGDLSNSLTIHTTGQSGHTYSSHYQDMIEPWLEGEYFPMEWDRADVELGAEGKLVLAPAD